MDNQNKIQPPHILASKMLIEWRNRMGYSPQDACTALGCKYAQLTKWELKDSVPLYIGLACAALALGMKPYEVETVYKE